MQRNFLRGLLICLLPCLAAGYFAFRLDKYRLGIDLAGGTILVYEINVERTRQLNAARESLTDGGPRSSAPVGEGLSSDDMAKLAAQIKRRIDPADLKNVTVRPLGSTRLEIILPTGGSGGSSSRANLTSEEIQEVKLLVSKMGVLEFRILANQADDEAGVRAARELLDGTSPEDLDALAKRGLPPPAPGGEYEVKAEGDKPVKVKYAWVELVPEERLSLGLSNAAEGSGGLWAQAAAARVPGAPTRTFTKSFVDEKKGFQSVALFTSRPVLNPARLDKEKGEQERLAAEGKGDEFNPKKVEYFVLTRVSPADSVRVEGDISLSAHADTDPRTFNPSVVFTFNGAGAQAFGRMTERNKPAGGNLRVLAILLDDQIVSAPTLSAVITNTGTISGSGFTKKTVDRTVNFLRNGALNAQLGEKPVSENTIGPTLGADTIKKGTTAVGLAFAAVLVFMVFYYRVAGLVACVALLANLLLTVGFMVAVNAAFTLPGLAGVVLMLGMAVDANVLIYERLREERNKGANLPTALRNGYDRAFLTIIDTHLTSIFTAIVLYTFGNDQLKGFAISLTVGLIISLFTSLYMTRLLFDYGLSRRWITELRMLRLFERPNFNPMKYRFFFFSLTTALTVLGLALFVVRGDAGLNVDFRGGTVYTGRLKAGEERALTGTDGKPGLRDLLGEEAQRSRLQVASARWVRPAGADAGSAAAGSYTFDVSYQDGMTRRVTLTERPPGATEAEMEAEVAARARHLPDVSVEQVFLSTDPDFGGGKSRIFTIRTTERQRELVQLALDRLLRNDAGDPLMDQTKLAVGPVVGSKVTLTFDHPTSPSYLKDLLRREFEAAGAVERGDEPFVLRGVPPETDGRFAVMELDVSKNPRLGKLAGLGVGAVAGGLAVADPELGGQASTLEKVLADTKAAFESRPVPERLEVFDSTLAKETRFKAFQAILWSWLAILVYLWFRFGNWTFGLAAVLCLVHDLCFTLGAIAVCHYLFDNPFGRLLALEDFKIDLAAVAALLTLVGYSVNEIIVNFARIREVRGKNPALTPRMINDSVNQTLSRTILTSMTVFLVSIVLYVFGGEGVHLFAFVMVTGVLVSTYSSIFVASPLLLMLGEGRHAAAEQATAEAERAEKVEEEYIEG